MRSYSLLVALLLPALAAHAQTTFSIGPRLGLNVSHVPFKDPARTYSTTAHAGLEVGAVANISFGHFAVQPALLYSQKGFSVQDTYTQADYNTGAATPGVATTSLDEQYRLNYLTLPLNLAYCQQANGQGFQVFAGPYVGLLLGGTYRLHDSYSTTTNNNQVFTTQSEGDVGIGDYYTTNRTDTKFYSRGFDVGLQGGLGYRLGSLLVQAGYSLGLRNLGANFKTNYGQFGTKTEAGPTYKSRTFQLSATYLFSSTK